MCAAFPWTPRVVLGADVLDVKHGLAGVGASSLLPPPSPVPAAKFVLLESVALTFALVRSCVVNLDASWPRQSPHHQPGTKQERFKNWAMFGTQEVRKCGVMWSHPRLCRRCRLQNLDLTCSHRSRSVRIDDIVHPRRALTFRFLSANRFPCSLRTRRFGYLNGMTRTARCVQLCNRFLFEQWLQCVGARH